MKRTVYWNMCLMAVLAIVLTTVLTTVVYYGNLEEQMRREIVTEVKYLEAGLERSGTKYLDEMAVEVRATSRNRITWVESGGAVL